VESEGMVWVVDAECGKGNINSENGVQTVSEHLDIIAMSDTQDRQKDRVSFAGIQ
jgi:predicted type IV restriction endonuclease